MFRVSPASCGTGENCTNVLESIVLKDELETTMRLCGVTHLSQVHPGLVNTLAIDHLVPDSDNHPYARWRPKANM